MAVYNVGQTRSSNANNGTQQSSGQFEEGGAKNSQASNESSAPLSPEEKRQLEIQQTRQEVKAARAEERDYERKAEKKRDKATMASFFDPLSLTGGAERSENQAINYDSRSQESNERAWESNGRLKELERGEGA